MKNSENIDKIFLEVLNTYERQPNPQAWKKLEAKLNKNKNEIIPIWWKYASAATVALILASGSYWFSNQKVNSINEVAVNQKAVIIKKSTYIVEKEAINELVNVESNFSKKALFKTVKNLEIIEKKQFAQLSPQQQTVHVEEIKQFVKLPSVEFKKIEEQNTIVLILENTKPKIEEETIVLNMVETKPDAILQTELNDGVNKKETRLSKIWQQLKRAKNGENVNWSEVGIKPQKMLARADAKIENVLTKGEDNEK